MIRTVTHKHLKRQFDIFEETEEIDNLLKELQFSTLLLPVDIKSNTLAFPLLHADDKRYAPVFTDVHEYNKFDFGDSFTLMPNEFDFYLNLLDEKIDGIIIDVEGERFPLTREFKDIIKPNSFPEGNRNNLTSKEIRQIRDSIDNCELEEFLEDPSNHWDYENLMDLLFKSDLFQVILSKDDISHEAHGGIISLGDRQLPAAVSSRFTESYALIFTGEDEVRPKNNPMHPYLQLVNLPEFINRVLLEDLDGIILNENSHNITIPRDFLLDYFKDFDGPDGDNYEDFAFVLGE